MLLQHDDVLALLKSPRNQAALSNCVAHEQRVHLHAVKYVHQTMPPTGLHDLLAWLEQLLPKDKFEKLKQLVRLPLVTNDLVGDIFEGLSRIFEAQDGLVEVELATPKLETDFEAYRTSIHEAAFWPGAAFRAAQRAPHSILVADLPAEQSTPYPEPYLVLLNIAQVFDTQVKEDGTLEYLLFRQPPVRSEDGQTTYLRVHAYCDGYYRIYQRPEEQEEWTQVTENQHQLGTCPARMLLTDPLFDVASPERDTPITGQLSALDFFVFWDASIEYYKMYGMWPILFSIEESCTYQTGNGEVCQGGILNVHAGWNMEKDEAGNEAQRIERFVQQKCPVCEARKLIGPGSNFKLPAPSKEMPEVKQPVGMVKVDIDALTNAREEQQARRRAIIQSCLGGDRETQNAAAKNEDQVQAGFEQKQDVLVHFKGNFEAAQQWALQMLGKLRYGPQFRRAYVSYGERFYLKTPEELQTEFDEAKKAGQPFYELSQKREFLYYTRYRNNPSLLDRMRILSDLEPYAEQSLTEIGTLLSGQMAGPLSTLYEPELLRLKARFPYYITLFEAQYGDIRRFGSLQRYHDKLRLITELLLKLLPAAPAAPPVPAPAPQLLPA